MTRSGNKASSPFSDAAPGPPSGMRTLVLTLDATWPAISGADLRNWQNAEAASALGPVALASVTAATGPPPAPIASYSLTDRPLGSVWRQAPTTAPADLIIPDDARDGLRRAIEAFAPDTLLVEHPALAGLAAEVRGLGMRLVVDLHNVDSAAESRMASALPFTSRRRWRTRQASRASMKAERAIAAAADAVWVCSGDEEVRFRSLAPSPPVHVVPNGIPRSRILSAGLPVMREAAPGEIRLLFVGHLGYPPNVDAAQWLARDILPALRERLDARLVLAGRSPAPDVQALDADPGIDVIADPDDLEPILAGADIAVLPIRLGGGTRFKVLEAMSRGLPVVATRFAVEGLTLTDRLHYSEAGKTRDFVDTISGLAADPTERSRLREAAWSHCLENFGPKAIARAVRAGLVGS